MSFLMKVARRKRWLNGSQSGPRHVRALCDDLQQAIWRAHEAAPPGAVTFVAIAKATGVSPVFVGNVAHGNVPGSVRALHHYEALASYLNIDLSRYY